MCPDGVLYPMIMHSCVQIRSNALRNRELQAHLRAEVYAARPAWRAPAMKGWTEPTSTLILEQERDQ